MDEKLQKVLARCGFGSRRQMEQWIVARRVKVNGRVATIGDRVGSGDRVVVDGKKVSMKEPASIPQRILLYNKPEDEICTRSDPENRKTVYQKLPPLKHGRWIAVGRLDINTSGLLLFCTDGELANRLMRPASQIEREYAVRVLGDVTAKIVQNMHKGVMLEDHLCRFTDIQYFSGTGANQWYHVVLLEGRNREVRKLWESQGVKVSRLKRVRFGPIFMPSKVKKGQHCDLSPAEIKQLYKLVQLPVPSLDTRQPVKAKGKRK